MKNVFTTFCIVLLLNGLSLNAQKWLSGEIYMKTKLSFVGDVEKSTTGIIPLVALYGIDTIYYPFKGLGSDTLDKTCRIVYSKDSMTAQLISDLQALSYCDYAERSPAYSIDFTPNDLNSNQWYLNTIKATAAWGVTQGNANVVIAIVDNGVRTNHEDLAANIWINAGEIPNNLLDDDLNGYADDVNGFDVADRDNNPNPPAGIASNSPFNHGTHCAGIASGVTNNSKGIAGIGFKCKIMPVKCTRNVDSGNFLSNTLDGITYAMRARANIISMSFGGPSTSVTTETLISTAHRQGIVMVAAAGNDDTTALSFPAAYPTVISVGATNQNDKKAFFSNYGSTVDVMAPGEGIYSTLASGTSDYGFLSGTSMSTPLVAGLAGLVLAKNPTFTPTQMLNHLKANCDNINAQNPGFNGQLGAGRINAQKALGAPSAIGGMIGDEHGRMVALYPNPMQQMLYVHTDHDRIPMVRIFDMQGKQLLQSTSAAIDVRNLQSGMYFAHVFLEDGKSRVFTMVK